MVIITIIFGFIFLILGIIEFYYRKKLAGILAIGHFKSYETVLSKEKNKKTHIKNFREVYIFIITVSSLIFILLSLFSIIRTMVK